MAAASKYFQILLGPNFAEGGKNEIPLEGIDGPMLQSIVDYCYSGRITICEENVLDILKAASSMELVELEQRCKEFYDSNLSSKNVISTLSIADKFSLNDLKENALKIVYENLSTIPIEEFHKLDEHTFRKILSSDDVTVEESILFDRLMQWLNKNSTATERIKLAADMLKAIRLQHIPGEVTFNVFCLQLPLSNIPNVFSQILTEKIEPYFAQNGCLHFVLDEYRKRAVDNSVRSFSRKNLGHTGSDVDWMGLDEIGLERNIDCVLRR